MGTKRVYQPHITGPTSDVRSQGINRDVVSYDNFVEFSHSETAGLGEWLLTPVDGGGDDAQVIGPTADSPGGMLTNTTNNAAADVNSLQKGGGAFAPAAGSTLEFECEFQFVDSVNVEWFIGLCDVIGNPLTTGDDYIGFGYGVAGGAIQGFFALTGKGASSGAGMALASAQTGETQLASFSTTADATWYRVRFEVIGTEKVNFYLDGVKKGSITTNIPTTGMAVTMCHRTDTAVVQTMKVRYIYAAQPNPY